MSEDKFYVDMVPAQVVGTEDIFNQLYPIDVTGHTEKKNGLTYLSWAWAWAELKKKFPRANYKIYESDGGRFYFTDGRTCWVKTGVIVDGLEHIEYLPVMDYRNNSIPVDKVTSTDVNKAIQRSLTKAIGRHGLGLFLYAGEDLPEDEVKNEPKKEAKKNNEIPFNRESVIKQTRIMLKAMEQDEAKLFRGKLLDDMEDAEIITNNNLVKKEYDRRNGLAK